MHVLASCKKEKKMCLWCLQGFVKEIEGLL